MAAHLLRADFARIACSNSTTSDLTPSEALSGIAGAISLVSWIVLLLPQLIENYKNGRADALSLLFLNAWLLGDLTNLAGAIWGRLLPSVIAIAVYFCFADFVLLGQTIYYNRLQKREKEEAPQNDDPSQPLLPGSRRNSRRRSSAVRRDSLSRILNEPSQYSLFARNTFSLLGVCAAGIVGWLFAYWTGAWTSQPVGDPDNVQDMPLGAQILGYISAALYLCSRVPQIIHNYRKKSCEGLSLLFFCLSLLGNVSYGANILLHSQERQYVLDNLPWLLGSLGTMAEDAIIFIQFRIYSTSAIDDSEIF